VRVRVRDSTDQDAPALERLFEELGYSVAAADIPARLARFRDRNGGRVLVVDDDGTVIAFAAAEIRFPIQHAMPLLYVSAFAVTVSAQRKGVGRRLLEAVEALGRASGCSRAVLTSAERRADAHAFYVAAGWTYSGRRFNKDLAHRDRHQ
jgi:GNAT superfamily N-acetyltransferase